MKIQIATAIAAGLTLIPTVAAATPLTEDTTAPVTCADSSTCELPYELTKEEECANSALTPGDSRLDAFYQTVLERNPDHDGYQYWSYELYCNDLSFEWFVWHTTVHGEEYANSDARFTSSTDFVRNLVRDQEGFSQWLSVYEAIEAIFGTPTAKALTFLAFHG